MIIDRNLCKATPEELNHTAQAHYEDISRIAHSWHNAIPQAIRFWYLERPKLLEEVEALRLEIQQRNINDKNRV